MSERGEGIDDWLERANESDVKWSETVRNSVKQCERQGTRPHCMFLPFILGKCPSDSPIGFESYKHPMGGNAMGGNAMGGNAMGGNAMGGNAKPRVTVKAL